MIPDLVAGNGPFSGANGYEPYLAELAKHRDVYRPVNRQLLADWEKQESKLFRLQDAAEKYLWPSLHGEWISELLANPKAAPIFARRIRRGLQAAPIGSALGNRPIRLVVGGLSAVAAWKSLEFVPGIGTVDLEDLIDVFIAGAGASVLAVRAKRSGEDTIKLGIFYQQARKMFESG